MNIDNEYKACQAIEAWRREPAVAQARNLRLAIEALELNLMYYEQKGSAKGVARMERCIAIIRKRKGELMP